MMDSFSTAASPPVADVTSNLLPWGNGSGPRRQESSRVSRHPRPVTTQLVRCLLHLGPLAARDGALLGAFCGRDRVLSPPCLRVGGGQGEQALHVGGAVPPDQDLSPTNGFARTSERLRLGRCQQPDELLLGLQQIGGQAGRGA